MIDAATAVRPRLAFGQIWNMCFGFLGIQMGFALQNANVSRIFQTLGASIDEIPILWIAAPATGLIVQPLVGYSSDRTWTKLGRRRPYFLYGAIASALPWMLTNWLDVSNIAPAGIVPDSVRYAFYIGGSALFLAVLWTVITSREYSPEELASFGGKTSDDVAPAHGGSASQSESVSRCGAMNRLLGDPHWLLLSMVGVGIAWAAILSLPYAILSVSLPAAKMGVYMGIFNFFIVIPQLLAAGILGRLLNTFFGGEAVNALLIGSVSLVLAALSLLRVVAPADPGGGG